MASLVSDVPSPSPSFIPLDEVSEGEADYPTEGEGNDETTSSEAGDCDATGQVEVVSTVCRRLLVLV